MEFRILGNLLCMPSSFVSDSRRISPEICTFCRMGLFIECHRLPVCEDVKTCMTFFKTSWERRIDELNSVKNLLIVYGKQFVTVIVK